MTYMRCRDCGEYIPAENIQKEKTGKTVIRKCPLCGGHDLAETQFDDIEKDRAEAKRYSTALRELYRLDAMADPVHALEKMRELSCRCGFEHDCDNYYDYEIQEDGRITLELPDGTVINVSPATINHKLTKLKVKTFRHVSCIGDLFDDSPFVPYAEIKRRQQEQNKE